MTDLLAAHAHASNNRAEIEASTVCGCFYCLQTYPPSEINAWAGFDMNNFDNPDAVSAETALCPRCGSESVIGDLAGYALSQSFLSQMHEAWFERTIIRRPTPRK